MLISYYLQIIIPWCSPVSLRALFCMRPFIPDLEVNQIDVSFIYLLSFLHFILFKRFKN